MKKSIDWMDFGSFYVMGLSLFGSGLSLAMGKKWTFAILIFVFAGSYATHRGVLYSKNRRLTYEEIRKNA